MIWDRLKFYFVATRGRVLKMYNYKDLSDFEFEKLCKDIMEKKLDTKLRFFARGRDGGIDIRDNSDGNIIIQVKHYYNSNYASLKKSLEKELDRISELNPKQYYVCCSKELTNANINEIRKLFIGYMDNIDNIVTLTDIDEELQKDKNIEIVKKHYKLWLASSNVLSLINNNHMCIDCEAFFYDIEEQSKEFVETKYYFRSKEILEKERMLLLLGAPGVGKTVTTKMLALQYLNEGYRLRHATNGDIKDIKNAISADRALNEVIIIDDCLGQHYLNMKETQSNELLALIKYVANNKNKKLILNSRITIYNEAIEQSLEMKYFTEDEKINITTINMSGMSLDDKGYILYNHLYFSKVPKAYFENIVKDKNYRKIVSHINYTPRIMEFVTKKVNYSSIKSTGYYEYIKGQLDNPQEIWRDEFDNKLGKEDRLFLRTLYSLTDTTVEEDVLRRSFEKRIMNSDIDTTRDVWEAVNKRLNGSMTMLTIRYGKKEVGVINPSVNDFLKKYIDGNILEKEGIKKYATEFKQIKRIFPEGIENLVSTGEILKYNFKNDYEKSHIILSEVIRRKVFNDIYIKVIGEFLREFEGDSIQYAFHENVGRGRILAELFEPSIRKYYQLDSLVDENGGINEFLNCMEFHEYCGLVENVDDIFLRENEDVIINGYNEAIEKYFEYVPFEDEYFEGNIGELISEHTETDELGRIYGVDTDKIEEIVNENATDGVYNEVYCRVKEALNNRIDINRIEINTLDISIDQDDIKDFVSEGLIEDAESYRGVDHNAEIDSGFVLDMMFNR